MRRLIEKGLMFGNLIPVRSPIWVERYNRALKSLTGRTTALTDFHVDISGYSPEIGNEFDDPLYLNPNGVNRQFILLTPEQKTAPLLEAQFSTSRDILRQFIEANEPALFALTAADVVLGELVNSVFDTSSPRDVLAVREIRIEADSAQGTLATVDALQTLITRFRTAPGAWYDDVLIAQMIELAKQTGDLTRQPLTLEHTRFVQSDFWTAHYGGLYVFSGTETSAVIAADPGQLSSGVPVDHVFGLEDRQGIARFLGAAGLIAPILTERSARNTRILRRKMDLIVVDVATQLGETPQHDPRSLRALARRHASALPEAWHGLATLLRWAEEGGRWPRIDSGHEAFFYSLRAAQTPQKDLVNRLLAELAPRDVLQLFICNKEAFYRAYATWPPEKRAFVANFLEREYKADKTGMRADLFGEDPPPRAPMTRTPGPWG